MAAVAIGLSVRPVSFEMSKVVSLNKFKKKQAKQQRVKQADTNRRLHGRTNAERAHDAFQKKKLETSVDHARLGAVPSAPEDAVDRDDSQPD